MHIIPTADEGWLHSVDSGAGVDGPGMRFAYFMAGCQFQCLYCHNPDTWKLHNGRRVSLDEAVAEAAPYAAFLERAGGITVSGGEPMMQAPFVGALLTRLKADFGLHTALDTQGFLHADIGDPWFEAVDLVLLDIKHADPEPYLHLTGKPLQPTLDFAHRMAALGKPLWIRHVLVPGLTDDPGALDRLAAIVADLDPVVERVEVLPFHQFGQDKWRQLGMDYTLADTAPPEPEAVAAARQPFLDRGLIVT